MMIGIQNVNRFFITYHLITLLLLFLFAIYDQRHHMIRNRPLAVFLVWCLFSIPLEILSGPNISCQSVCISKLLGCISGFFLLFLIALATNGGIGGGDIKLVSLLGILYGMDGLISVLFFSCLCCLLILIPTKLLKIHTCENIPFAPYLFAGSVFYMMPQLIQANL